MNTFTIFFMTNLFIALFRPMFGFGFKSLAIILSFSICTNGYTLQTDSAMDLSPTKTFKRIQKSEVDQADLAKPTKKTPRQKSVLSERSKDLLYFTLKALVIGSVILGVVGGCLYLWKNNTKEIRVTLTHTVCPETLSTLTHLGEQMTTAVQSASTAVQGAATTIQDTSNQIINKAQTLTEQLTTQIKETVDLAKQELKHKPNTLGNSVLPLQKEFQDTFMEYTEGELVQSDVKINAFTEEKARNLIQKMNELYNVLTPPAQTNARAPHDYIVSKIATLDQHFTGADQEVTPEIEEKRKVLVQTILECSKGYLESLTHEHIAPNSFFALAQSMAPKIEESGKGIGNTITEFGEAVKVAATTLKDIQFHFSSPALTEQIGGLASTIGQVGLEGIPIKHGIGSIWSKS